MAYYLDTSALVKRYAQEAGATWVMGLTTLAAGHDLYIVRITGPEMIAALFRIENIFFLSFVDNKAAING